MSIKALYVFVDILIDIDHFVATIKLNFQNEESKSFYLISTIQFNSSIFAIRDILTPQGFQITIPQEKPRCAGEVPNYLIT